MARQVKVFLIRPHDSKFPPCLVYADSEEDARTSCTSPAVELGRNQILPDLLRENSYTDDNQSTCREIIVAVNPDQEWNNGQMIDFPHNGKTYPLQKHVPDYLDD